MEDDKRLIAIGDRLMNDYKKVGASWDATTIGQVAATMIDVCEAAEREARKEVHIYYPYRHSNNEPECCNRCGGHKTLQCHLDAIVLQKKEHPLLKHWSAKCDRCGLWWSNPIHIGQEPGPWDDELNKAEADTQSGEER